jgi:isopentenyldiphosphate isomerase
MDELLDIVDVHDTVIGVKHRSEIYNLGMRNFRVINAFAKDRNGRLWIPRRSEKKELCPLALDVSVGGHVKSGETYDEAFARELHEEITITIDSIEPQVLGTLTPHTHGVSAFMKVYEFSIDFDPLYNKDDFTEFFWILPKDLALCIAAGEPAKSDLPLLLKQFYQ